MINTQIKEKQYKKKSFFSLAIKDIKVHKVIYLMLLPVLAYYLIFHYYPMYGAQIAFKDFNPKLGIIGSPWVGLKHFKQFFGGMFVWRLIRNTLVLNFYGLIIGFPIPIILAIIFNEVKNLRYKKMVQTISYLPHFISTVVICGMIHSFVASNGFITNIFVNIFGIKAQNLLYVIDYFRSIYVVSDIWQQMGWGSIIYIAALSGISMELYEAAKIDGAGKFKQIIHVTIPGIMPTIIVMLILRVGRMMSLGFEKVFLLYNPAIYEKADVISTYVYRKGILEMNYSFSTAVGIFNSIINMILLITVNNISRKVNENSLW